MGEQREGSFEEEEEESDDEYAQKPRELPADLPRTLDDRKNFNSYNQETEYYDAWQGEQSNRMTWAWTRVDAI